MSAGTYQAWTLPAFGRPLERAERPVPQPHPAGVVVRIESAMVLSYMARVLEGSLGYATPPFPFVPGTNAIGTVEAAGAEVYHVAVGERVFLSPHLIADEPTEDPAQILIGLTAMGAEGGPRRLQQVWRDGVFAELAHWPASCVTPLRGFAHVKPERLIGLAKLVVPYGGLLRAGLAPGHTVLVNGATGYYGSAALMVALAMGAGRVVALGRDAVALRRIADTLGPRVVPAVLGGTSMEADLAAIAGAAGGRAECALDILGRAASTATTLATLRALRRRGRLVLMGSATAPLALGFGEMLGNDWEVVGNFMYPKAAPAELAALLAAGLLDLAPLRPAAFPLADLPAAITAAAEMRDFDVVSVSPALRPG
jgi:alcohol dehydrogenase